MPKSGLPDICCHVGAPMSEIDPRRAGGGLAAACAVAALVFSLWPGLDLQASGLFYRPGAAFWLAQVSGIEAFRNLVWDLTIMVFVIALAGVALALAGRPLLGVPLRDWAYIAVLYLLGPVLLANMVLKAHWGRARPADVSDFGGAHLFTPFWQPTDQCLANCSFVSGEVSSTVVMGIALLVLHPAVRRCLPKTVAWLWVLAAYALPLVVTLQRVATGRHFLSDAVFAALFMLALALVLLPIRGAAGRRAI